MSISCYLLPYDFIEPLYNMADSNEKAVRSEKLEVRNGGGGASNLKAPHYNSLVTGDW